MQDLSKTKRLLSLAKWLIEAKSTGIAKATILETFDVSPKTFTRDLKDLKNSMPFLKPSYDKENERLYGEFVGPGPAQQRSSLQKGESPTPSPFGNATLDPKDLKKITYTHFQDRVSSLLSKEQSQVLLQAILDQDIVQFDYKEQQRQGVPLFLYYYGEYWYLFVVSAQGKIMKYRTDLINHVGSLLLKGNSLSKEVVEAHKQSALAQVQKAQNMFVDLNAKKELRTTLRFFLSRGYLEKALPHHKSMTSPKDNPTVTDVNMTFSGFEEAKFFLNHWLGKVQILSPESFRTQYMDAVEDALDIL